MTEGNYKIGDVIWAKMKGYPPWPARIASPHETTIKNADAEKSKAARPYYLVYFFGSNNYAWMPEETLKPYEEFAEENKKKTKKTAQYSKGLKAIEEYIRKVADGTLTPPPEPAKEEEGEEEEKEEAEEDEEEEEEQDTNDVDPSSAGDSLGPLPSIEEELAIVKSKKPVANSASNKKTKNSHDSHDDSAISSSVASSVQKDYSRTPFNQQKRKSTRSDETTTEITSPTKRLKANDEEFEAPNLSTISTPKAQVPSKIQARNIITKGQQQSFPPVIDTPQVDSSFRTNRYKDIRPSQLKFGFIGLGMMGQLLVKHLIGSRHSVTVWNRNRDRMEPLEKAGATLATTPSDVISACDITFSCLSGPAAIKETLFSQYGVLCEMAPNKSYIELSSIDPETSTDISEAIIAKGGSYLSASMITSGRTSAQNGDLIIIASGDRHVYDNASSCFKAMSSKSIYLSSDVTAASRMNLVASSFFATIVGSLVECLRILDRASLKGDDFLEIIKLSTMNSPLAEQTLLKVLKKRQEVEVPIDYLQKDLRMLLNMSEEKETGCPIAAIVNEVFKSKKRLAEGGDASSLYYASI